MKLLFTSLILSAIAFNTFSQIKNSENGYVLPTEGTVRILVVYAQVDYSISGCPAPGDTYGANSEWPAGGAPYWETGGGTYTFPKPLFDASTITTGDGTLSDYYYQASLGEYAVLGDYYSISIPCTATGLTGYGDQAVINYLNSNPVISSTGKHFSDFDLVNGYGKGLVKTAGSDQNIDCMFIIWKNNSYGNAGCSAGLGVNSGYSYSITDVSGTFTVPIISIWGGCSWDGAFYTFTAEFMHAILGGNNWHSGGGAGPWTFMTPPKDYCTSAQYDNQSNMFCGWDRNHLGWQGGKQFLISAHDASNTSEVQTDLTQPTTAGPFEATYVLRDFAYTGDAVRIKLPYINWTTNGDVKNQYLWIENHQMISNFDHYHFEGAFQSTPMTEGLMTYIQVGKDRKLGTSTTDDIFVDGYPSSKYPDPNCLGSWLFPITAEGNYDFKYRTDMLHASDCWSSNVLPTEKAQSVENSLTGCSDSYNFYDYNLDGKIISPGDGVDVYRGEVVNGNTF